MAFTRLPQKNLSRCGSLSLDRVVLGVDGCAAGWFAVSLTGTGYLYPNFSALIADNPDAHCYVDIPMGLPNLRPRDLELQARRLLAVGEGPSRGSSLFPVPSRDAVYADDYIEACAVNLARFGKKLSLQSWNICRKIREVDEVFLREPDLVSQVFESHPELAFRQLNGKPLTHNKKSGEGRAERISILGQHLPAVSEQYEAALRLFRRKDVARDDILDAMVLAVVGSVKQLEVTGDIKQDERGVPIRMKVPDVPVVD